MEVIRLLEDSPAILIRVYMAGICIVLPDDVAAAMWCKRKAGKGCLDL